MLHYKIQKGSWTPIFLFKEQINWKNKEINKYISFQDCQILLNDVRQHYIVDVVVKNNIIISL